MNWNFTFTRKQARALRLLRSPGVKELCFGGAKGGGKSAFGCVYVCATALMLIEAFGLPRTTHPLPVGFMGRKLGVHFRKTTFETWQDLIPSQLYRVREQAQEIVIRERVKVDFGGFDSRETLNRFNSAEYIFAFIDQAEELGVNDVGTLRASMRRMINGQDVDRHILWTANPAACFLQEEFPVNLPAGVPQEGPKRFVRALFTDNPHLPADYEQTLINAFRHRPELLAAYKDGSWEKLAGVDQVIHSGWIENAMQRRLYPLAVRRLITCDPARFGDDETVIYVLDNTEITESLIYGQEDLNYTANQLAVLSRKYEDCTVAFDACGSMCGLEELLINLQVPYIAVNGAEKAEDSVKYANRRAEIWDVAARMFSEGDVMLHDPDPELVRQLTQPRYRFRTGRLLVEPKEDIKSRLGRSPDHADAYVQGLAYLSYVNPVGEEWRPPAVAREDYSAMAV